MELSILDKLPRALDWLVPFIESFRFELLESNCLYCLTKFRHRPSALELSFDVSVYLVPLE